MVDAVANHDGAAGDEMASADQESDLSENSGSCAESGFKEQVCAAYRGDPNSVKADFNKDLTFKDGLWFKDQTLVVPKVGNLKQECMREMHDTPLSGHLGVTKAQKAVMRLFWWPIVSKDVKHYVQTCHSCLVKEHKSEACWILGAYGHTS